MKRIIAMLMFVFMLSGCATNESSSSLSLTNVINFFGEHGVQLHAVDDIEPNYPFYKTLNGVTPSLFSVNDDQKLSIYVFPSNSDVDKGVEDFKDMTATAGLEMHERYVVNNLLVFYILGGDRSDPVVNIVIEEMKAID